MCGYVDHHYQSKENVVDQANKLNESKLFQNYFMSNYCLSRYFESMVNLGM